MSDPASDAVSGPRNTPFVDPQARILALVEILLCSSVPTQLAIGAVLRTAGLASLDAAGGLSLTFVLALSIADTLLLILLMVLLTRAHGESPRQLWIGSRPVSREVTIGLVTVPFVYVTVGILLNALRLLLPSLHNVPTNPLEQLASTPEQAAVFSLVAILAGGVREELQRAFMLHRFEQYLGGSNVGLLVVSIAFGFGHTAQGWDAVITTAILGAYWAWLYLGRRSSIAPMISHAGFNSLEILRVAMVGQ